MDFHSYPLMKFYADFISSVAETGGYSFSFRHHVHASKTVVCVWRSNYIQTMPETYHNYIDGEWRASETGETIEVRNPADTDDIIAEYQQSSADDAAGAIEAAAATTEQWANTPGPTRGSILRETARHLEDREDELTKLLVREEGKTLSEAGGEVGRAINIFYYTQRQRY